MKKVRITHQEDETIISKYKNIEVYYSVENSKDISIGNISAINIQIKERVKIGKENKTAVDIINKILNEQYKEYIYENSKPYTDYIELINENKDIIKIFDRMIY